MPSHKNFAVFILTHGRPNHILTFESLKRHGYTGAVYFIVDNEDSTVDEYRRMFGDERVVVFDKEAIAAKFDIADTQPGKNAVVYARNASYEIAADLGLDYFLQLDDDYSWFQYRWFDNSDQSIRSRGVRSMDQIIEAMLTFLDDSGAATVAWSQGGDHMGGAQGRIHKKLLRKAMNSYFCRTDKPVGFLGRINDDVNAYVVHGGRGQLFFTVMAIQLLQAPTQKQDGGMSDEYRTNGTYAKSFYSVMMRPDCIQIATMGMTNRRYHHHISWDKAVPKILSSKYR